MNFKENQKWNIFSKRKQLFFCYEIHDSIKMVRKKELKWIEKDSRRIEEEFEKRHLVQLEEFGKWHKKKQILEVVERCWLEENVLKEKK